MNNPVLAIIVPRLATGIFILFGVSILITLGIEALSGDVCSAILGQAAEPSTVAACQAQLGIDRPLHIRYIEWLGNVLQGDFGTSLANNREVGEQIGKRLGNTLFLAVSTSIFAVPVGIFLGVIAALYRNSFIDHAISTTTLSTIASPEFFVAYILMAIFAVKLGWLPAISNVDSSMGIFERLRGIGTTGYDPGAGDGRAYDAHDPGLDRQPAGQSLHRNGQTQGIETESHYSQTRLAQCLVADHTGHCS